METKQRQGLLGELERLAAAAGAEDFTVSADIDGLSGEEREAVRLLGGILEKYRAAAEDNALKYELTNQALGVAQWDMEIRDNDPFNPDNGFSCSPTFRLMLGFSDERDFPGMLSSCTSRLHPTEKESVLKAFAEHVADRTGKTPCDLECRLKTKDGEYRHFRMVGTTKRDETGRPLRMAGVLEDITERKKTLAQLYEAERRVDVMMHSVPLVVTMWNRDMRLIDCSQTAVFLLGFSSKRDCIRRFVFSMPEYQPDGRRSCDAMAGEIALTFKKGHRRCEYTHLSIDGEAIVFDVLLVRMEYKGDFVVVAYGRDMREERRMLTEIGRHDEKLAAQAHRYKAILDAVPLPVSVTDANMRLIFVNAAAEKIIGRPRGEITGRHCSIWNIPVCGTAECSVARVMRGLPQNFFQYKGASCQVDTEIIRDAAGEIAGFLEILHDITEVEMTARKQADAANEAKNVFLATMSHEMRTPLNAVIGLSELILDGGDLGGEAQANLENIYNAGSTLLGIVNDILDLSKITSGKFEILPIEYDVPSMINDAVAQNLLRIGSKPVRFVLDIDDNMPARLYGDDLRVKQIINNLLSNAFKYTEKGTVKLGLNCEREGGAVWMTIRVRDTGVGIRPEYRDRLFSDYSQLDVKANRKAGGTGLGLSITKSLAELMGGHIVFEDARGQGSIFTVKIRQQSVNDAVIGAELAANLKNFRFDAHRRGRNARLNRIKLPYARVLVVDDHLVNLDVAKGLMRPYGMQIDCVTSGREAVAAIRGEKVRYDAVFMDHMMPGMDGIEAARLIREIGTEYAAGIPIIALTANAIAGNEELFLRNGFQAFISKPVNMVHLDEVIRRFVRDKEREAPSDRSRPDKRRGRDRRGGEDRRVTQRRGESGLRALGGEIDGLDISGGLKYFGGEEAYVQVLRSYAVNTKALLDSLGAVERENLAGYAVTVHGIKGSSRGICAEPVGALAEALEHAAKSGNFDFVRENNPAFLESARKLAESIETLLDGMAKKRCRPVRDKPDDALLAKLLTGCEMYDMDGIDAAMAEIAAFDYKSDPEFVDWLRENVNRLNFTQIKERIEAM